MKTFQFERTIGKSVPGNLKIGNQKVEYQLYPLIPLEKRAEMIRAIIDSVITDGQYRAEYQDFVIKYFLIKYYTDVSVGSDSDGDDAQKETDRLDGDGANTIYEIYMTTDIMDDLRAIVIGFDTLMKDIDSGIESAKQEMYHSHGLNRIGDAIGDLIKTMGESLTPDDLRAALTALTSLAEGLDASE